jgi:hypothetical protein
LPSGSSNTDHQPNGCWTGATGNRTPRVLSDTLDGDEQAHDRGDACGAICHVDYQALSDRPIGGFVTPPGSHGA